MANAELICGFYPDRQACHLPARAAGSEKAGAGCQAQSLRGLCTTYLYFQICMEALTIKTVGVGREQSPRSQYFSQLSKDKLRKLQG